MSTIFVEWRHLDAFVNPFTGRRVEQTRCGVCGAALPLPGDYPMIVDRREPEEKLYDCTGDPGSTDKHGKPNIVQTGITVLKPVCLSHLQ